MYCETIESTDTGESGHQRLEPTLDLSDPETLLGSLRADAQLASAAFISLLWDDGHRLRDTSLGTLLPGLATLPDHGAGIPDLGVRATNSLGRARIVSWKALATIDPLKLRSLPNFGAKSFAEVIETALRHWQELDTTEPEGTRASDARTVRIPGLTGAAAEQPLDGEFDLARRVVQLVRASWAEAGAETFGEAIDAWSSSKFPADLLEALSQLRAESLVVLIGTEEVDEAAWHAILEFPPSTAAILQARTLAPPGEKATLATVGEGLGITRERVRQLQVQVERTLAQRVNSDAGAPFRHMASLLQRRVGDACTSSDLTAAVRTAVLNSSSPDARPATLRTRERTLEHLAGPFADLGGGVKLSIAGQRELAEIKRSVDKLAAGTQLEAQTADRIRLFSGDDPEVREPLLDHLRIRDLGGTLVTWRGAHTDKAEAVLTVRAELLTMAEIHAAVGFEVNPRSLSQRVQSDKRFMRRGKDHYGLRRWGGEEYSGIEEELEQAIERAGGEIDLEDTVVLFVREFRVSETSVRAYAAGRRFKKNGDQLSLRAPDDLTVVPGSRPLEMTPDAFRIGQEWHLRIDLDQDAVRGSGRPIRQAIAVAAGLEPDLTFGVDVDGETVVFSWSGNQPGLGSIRPLISRHGCALGDLLFLPLAGDEPRRAHIVRGADRAEERGMRRFAIEIGLDPNEIDPAEHPLVVSGLLDLPAGADWSDIVDRLRARGDAELVDWLPEQLL